MTAEGQSRRSVAATGKAARVVALPPPNPGYPSVLYSSRTLSASTDSDSGVGHRTDTAVGVGAKLSVTNAPGTGGVVSLTVSVAALLICGEPQAPDTTQRNRAPLSM